MFRQVRTRKSVAATSVSSAASALWPKTRRKSNMWSAAYKQIPQIAPTVPSSHTPCVISSRMRRASSFARAPATRLRSALPMPKSSMASVAARLENVIHTPKRCCPRYGSVHETDAIRTMNARPELQTLHAIVSAARRYRSLSRPSDLPTPNGNISNRREDIAKRARREAAKGGGIAQALSSIASTHSIFVTSMPLPGGFTPDAILRKLAARGTR